VPLLAVALMTAGCADSRLSANNSVAGPAPQASNTTSGYVPPSHGGMISSTGYSTDLVTFLGVSTRDDAYDTPPSQPGPGAPASANGQQVAAAPQPHQPPPVMGLYGIANNASGGLYTDRVDPGR
jgi:hypothetical protein